MGESISENTKVIEKIETALDPEVMLLLVKKRSLKMDFTRNR